MADNQFTRLSKIADIIAALSVTRDRPEFADMAQAFATLDSQLTAFAEDGWYSKTTWVPIIGGSGGTSGQTYAAQVGWGFKLGKLAIAGYDVVLSNKGVITTNAQIQGFPYTASVTVNGDGTVAHWTNLSTAVICIPISIAAGTTAGRLFLVTAATLSATGATMTGADISNTTRLAGLVVYKTD